MNNVPGTLMLYAIGIVGVFLLLAPAVITGYKRKSMSLFISAVAVGGIVQFTLGVMLLMRSEQFSPFWFVGLFGNVLGLAAVSTIFVSSMQYKGEARRTPKWPWH